jgi:hypothetical protein
MGRGKISRERDLKDYQKSESAAKRLKKSNKINRMAKATALFA